MNAGPRSQSEEMVHLAILRDACNARISHQSSLSGSIVTSPSVARLRLDLMVMSDCGIFLLAIAKGLPLSFIQHMGRSFGTQQVVVIHLSDGGDEERTKLEAQVQSKKAFFDAEAQVYLGDRLEILDPRGGVRLVLITEVDINQAGGGMPSYMSHIEATFVEREPTPTYRAQAHQTIQGGAIIITGDHVNVATHGGSVSQHLPVTPGYEDLARAVKGALQLIDSDELIDAVDRAVAGDASSSLLDEIVKEEPDHKVLRGSLAILRGVLVARTNAAASAVGSGLVHQLMVPPA